MAFILACDTTHGNCTVAIVSDAGQVVGCATEPQVERQAERLLTLIEEALAQAGIDYAALEAVAVTTGPGSFTGIRIGLASARGIALVLDKPVVGVSSFESIYWQYRNRKNNSVNGVVAVVMDARRGQVYAQLFDPHGTAVDAPCMLENTAFFSYLLPHSAGVIIGNAASLFQDGLADHAPGFVMIPDIIMPEAVSIAHVAYKILIQGKTADFPAAPLYIRLPDATPSSKK